MDKTADPSTRRHAGLRACLLGLMLGLSPAVNAQTGVGEAPLAIAPVPSVPIADGFTFAAVGDLIYLRPMGETVKARSANMLRLLAGADVTFGNFETTVLDLTSFEGSPQAESGGTWMLADTRVPSDLAEMGFDLVSFANNHTTDWGVEGMAETGRRLDGAGLVHSGAGKNMSAARAPRYLDVAAGRIGLVSATSTFPAMSRASDPYGEIPGRPGVNTLRTDRYALVTRDQLDALAGVAAKSPLRNDGAKDGTVRLLGSRFRVGDASGERLGFAYEPHAEDVRANLLAVRQAKQNGNFVAFSLHNHEPGNDSPTPASFAVEFARRVIDEGADVFIGHGPHRLRGIEIYKGKPIFYSLGNFAMMNNSLDAVPADMFEQYGVQPGSATTPEILQARNARSFGDRALYESVIAVSRYDGGRVKEIRLHPIELGVNEQGAGRGVPRMADAATGRSILEQLRTLSAPFGTKILIENGVGIIRP